jgi:spermidine synthase
MTDADHPSPFRLFALGFLTLFLELALIRYLAGTIWNLGFFPNLVLLGVFLGMGTGFVGHRFLSRRGAELAFAAVPVAMLALVLLVQFLHPSVPGFGQEAGEIGGEIFFTSTDARHGAVNYLLFPLWLGAVVAVFAMISVYTAKLFRELAPLRAYTLDIGGSCCGILTFMLLSWAQVPAFAWFVLAIPLLILARTRRTATAAAVTVVMVGAAAWVMHVQDTRLSSDPRHEGPLVVTWSPYQKVEFADDAKTDPFIYVNGIRHQALHEPDQIRQTFYQAPYDARRAQAGRPPYERVLVIGAGCGNDVASAIMNGVGEVDALEIDPVIAALGRRFHPAHPYDDPRVRLRIGDGREFLTNARGPYDLIVFALTDSLVKVSAMAQLRLENYIFTREAIARAFELLSPDGTLVFYNYYRRPWILAKLERAIRETTDREPVRLISGGSFTLMTVARAAAGGAAATAHGTDVEPATDDWPFPYLQHRGLPRIYVGAMLTVCAYVAILLLVVEAVRPATNGAARGPLSVKLAFALMGAAFLLLEAKSVIQFSLLFGTTWLNNSLVFLAVLVLVLAGNWTAQAVRGRWLLWGTFPLLVASTLATLAYPLSHLLYVENGTLRFAAASLLTFAPVFFANVLFSTAFRDQPVAEQMFGWNLFGATIGGALEYVSMALGYNALAGVVAVAYAAAFGLLLAGGVGRPSTAALALETAGGSSPADRRSRGERRQQGA